MNLHFYIVKPVRNFDSHFYRKAIFNEMVFQLSMGNISVKRSKIKSINGAAKLSRKVLL